DQDEVAGARVHWEPRLGRVVAIVPGDQLIDVLEVPELRVPLPLACQTLLVAAVFREQRRPQFGELPLVLFDRELDRPQPAHPGDRSAECGKLRARVRPEVAEPHRQRVAPEGIPLQILRERFPLHPVAGRLRPRCALPHDRLPLTPLHVASVPFAVAPMSGSVASTGRLPRTYERSSHLLMTAPQAVS